MAISYLYGIDCKGTGFTIGESSIFEFFCVSLISLLITPWKHIWHFDSVTSVQPTFFWSIKCVYLRSSISFAGVLYGCFFILSLLNYAPHILCLYKSAVSYKLVTARTIATTHTSMSIYSSIYWFTLMYILELVIIDRIFQGVVNC